MKRPICCLFAASLLYAATVAMPARGANPTPEQALVYVPIQKNVDFDRPSREEVARAKVTIEKIDGHGGYVVWGPNGLVLRKFADTNGDGLVDQWRYYKNGLEIYRDIDSDFNKKADQYRWFHTAGSRWGIDKNEDGVVDAWKAISAEEVTAEVVSALATKDAARFARVALAPNEIAALALGREKAADLAKKISGLQSGIQQALTANKDVPAGARWVQFTAGQPGVVPAGTDGSSRDLTVYENVIAITQSGDQTGQVLIGTLVQLGDTWRVIDLPQSIAGGDAQLAAGGFFFHAAAPESTPQPASSGPSAEMQELLTRLNELDTSIEKATSAEELARYNAQRADLLQRIAALTDKPEDRVMWLRQLADTVSAAVQMGGYPGGAKRLEQLFAELEKNPGDGQLAAYVRFRQLLSEYGAAAQNASTTEEFAKVQEDWLVRLEQYVKDYPESPDSAEAMLQLGTAQEFAGEEDEAKKWYAQVVAKFPNASQAAKAAGATRRLESVGRAISLRGQDPNGGAVDLAGLRGKVVLIQYWATWCTPCKADMPTLRDMLSEYGSKGFAVLGVNLDTNRQEVVAYLRENRLPWPQVYEEGGLDSRLANEMGIFTLPTMLLVDQQGKVVNRNLQAAELEDELKKLLK